MRLLFLVAASSCISADLDGDGVPARVDCNDTDPAQLLQVELHIDSDGDGFGGPELARGCPGSGWLTQDDTDCNDSDPEVFPGAVEIGCNGADDDCDPSTPDGPAYTTGSTHASVQEALDAVGFYEWVQLCGSIIEERVVISRPCTLRGAGTTRSVLDSSDLSGSTLSSSYPLVIEELTLRGGNGTVGGVLSLEDAGEVTLHGVILEGGTGERGGGMAVRGETTLFAQDVTLTGHRAERGGGLYVEDPAQITLTRVYVLGNEAAHGGGIWTQADLHGSELLVEGNLAERGGGLYLEREPRLTVQGARIVGNRARQAGGGAFGTGLVEGAWIEQNEADVGGGLATSGALEVRASELRANAAQRGGGLGLLPGAALELEGVIVTDNEAVASGGGLYAHQAQGTLLDVLLWDNRAARGGAGHTSCASLSLTGSGLANNRALQAGAWAVQGGETRFEETAFSGTQSLGLDSADLTVEPGCSEGVLFGAALTLQGPLTLSLDGEVRPTPTGDFRCMASGSRSDCVSWSPEAP